MISTVIGGAMLPHAPQFFTMPDTEDKATVEQVRAVAADIGDKLKALKPDLWIIFSNDHAEQFFHNVRAAVHHPCRRRGERRIRRPQVSLEDPERDRLRDRARSSIARTSIPPSPAPRRSTTPSAFR